MHGITDSMEAAALLVVAVAKEHGDITRDSISEILSMFEHNFGIKRRRSIELYSSSIYYLKDSNNVPAEVPSILKPSKDSFSIDLSTKLIQMLNSTALLED